MKKKTVTIIFWVATVLFGAFILSSAIPNIMMDAEWVKIIHTDLGYPLYLIPLLGYAKLLGVIGIVVRKFPRLTEWAYAGLFFDITGAMYSGVAVGGFQAPMLFMILPYALLATSYIFHHKLLAMENNVAVV